MGKPKRRKPPRRQKSSRASAGRRRPTPQDVDWRRVEWEGIDRAFTSFEPESLISLVSAAADSPGCCHRLPSLALLWLRAVTHPPQGGNDALPTSLPRLLVAARRAAPQLRYLEDCWNADPRLLVCYPIGGDRLRIHPGPFTDPAQLLRVVQSTAAAIDAYVLDQHGFSLSDLLEAALRYSDWRLHLISPTWPSQMLQRDEPEPDGESLKQRVRRIGSTPLLLRQEERDAVTASSFETWIAPCAHPERAAIAWEWATLAESEFELCLEPTAEELGTALAARSERLRPVPASLVLSALAAATRRLATEAATDPTSVAAMVSETVRRALGMLSPSEQARQHEPIDLVPEDASPSPPGGLGMIAVAGERHAFATCVVSGLDPEGLKTAIDGAEHVLADITVDKLRESGIPIDSTGLVRPLVLYGGPFHKRPPDHPGATHLHVEDLASMKLDAEQSELGQDLIFQFLDEVTTMPGVDRLFCLESTDIWRHWKLEGVLNPTGADGVGLKLDCTPDEEAWLTSAAWEPIEKVLTAAGLPPVSEWYTAQLDERGHAMLGTHRSELYLVLANPSLIIATSLNGGLVALGFDPTFGVGIADGLLLTCANFPAVAAGLSLPEDRPLMIIVEFTTERPPGATDDHVAVGFWTESEPQAVISLLFGPDWLEALAAEPQIAHRVLGETLAHCLDQLREGPDDGAWESIRAELVHAWESAPPVAMLGFEETNLTLRPKGQVRLPRSPATKARAQRALATAILEDKIGPCRVLGPDAQVTCKEKVVPAMNRVLNRVMADWSSEAILAVAEHLNDAHGERARAAGELERALGAPWAAHWQDLAKDAPDPSEKNRPLECLLELLLAQTLDGTVLPDRFDIAEAADLARLAMKIAVALSGAERGLHEIAVTIDQGGITHVIAGPSLAAAQEEQVDPTSRPALHFDVAAYREADRTHQLRIRQPDERKSDVTVRLDEERPRQSSPFVPLSALDVPGSLRSANDTMLKHCGTGIDAISAVLGTAVSWTSGDDRVTLVSREALRDEAQAWSSLPMGELESALDRLILDPARLRTEGVSYSEQDRRKHRLASRPLVLFNGQLILMPWQIRASQGVYLRYLLEGRLPWHPADVPDPVRNGFNEVRQVANRALERAADEIAANLQLCHKRNIHENVAAACGLQIPGEIDLLIADAARSRLWVCEVKDVSAAFSPQTVLARIRKFLPEDEDYIGKLMQRATAVERNPAAAAGLVSAPAAANPWRVIPLMITRTVEPSAFLDDVQVPFTVLDDLAATLQSDADPVPGLTTVGTR